MITAAKCINGRLRNAYPVGRHDVELVVRQVPPGRLTDVLRNESARILSDEPDCRKVIFAARADDLSAVAAAEEAGFRFVVEVDVPDGGEVLELMLLVREPPRVTRVDMDLDHPPPT